MLIGICDDELCCVEEIKEKIMNLDAQNLEIEIDCFVNQYEKVLLKRNIILFI